MRESSHNSPPEPRSIVQVIFSRTLSEGEPLKLMLDLQNDHDPHAVAVRTDVERMQIGYVPRYLAYDVWQLVQRCDVDFIELRVDRVNRDAPLQNRVLCRMRACWPGGFQPCGSEDFMPIPAGVPEWCEP
jgi:hypothetical protein